MKFFNGKILSYCYLFVGKSFVIFMNNLVIYMMVLSKVLFISNKIYIKIVMKIKLI